MNHPDLVDGLGPSAQSFRVGLFYPLVFAADRFQGVSLTCAEAAIVCSDPSRTPCPKALLGPGPMLPYMPDPYTVP
ncbi:MAG: hypothetical protein AAFR10_16825 [Pseudomonadota bacterium]